MKSNPLLVALLASALGVPAIAGELKEANITQIYNQVQTLDPGKPARTSVVHESIHGETAVRTGLQSRSELVFPDNTVTRLGANTLFSFHDGTRDMNLKNGTILLQVPKGIGGAKITTAAVTAAITGTTIMWEVLPGNMIKFIVLEGSARLYLNNKKLESVVVNAGQMVILPANPKTLSGIAPVDIDIQRLVATSLLIHGMNNSHRITPFTFGPIDPTIKKQEDLFYNNELLETNLVINGGGSNVLVLQDMATTARDVPTPTPAPAQSTPVPTPTPNPLPVIDKPEVSTIDGLTTIQTDPNITRSGITGDGAIYRGESLDGQFSDWAFGSTNQLDSIVEYGSNTPSSGVATYKFLHSITLADNPTLNTLGGPTWVAFVTEGSITAESEEADVNFDGLRDVMFVSLNGNINLQPGIFFHHASEPFNITFYARNGNLNDSSSFNMSTGNVSLIASQNVNVSNQLAVNTALLVAGQDINFTSDARFSGNTVQFESGRDVFEAGNISTKNFNITAGRDLDFSKASSESIFAENMNFNAGGTATMCGDNFILFSDSEVNPTVRQTLVANKIVVDDPFDLPSTAIFNWYAGAGGIQASGKNLLGFNYIQSTGNVVAYNFSTKKFVGGGNVTIANELWVNQFSTTGNVSAGTIGDYTTSLIRKPLFAKLPKSAATNLSRLTASQVAATDGGIQFDSQFGGGEGGHLTLTVTGGGVTFGSGANEINGATFNGGDSSVSAGNGGSFTVNAAGDINVNTTIQATSGAVASGSPAPAGNGGSVALNANGTINVNDQIITSSNGDNNRYSATGGKISLNSNKKTGVAIAINNTGQLLSLLNSSQTTANGGRVIVHSAGGKITVNGATIQADKGAVVIGNTGDGNIGLTNATISADTLKARVMGTNGVLTISGGNLSADTLLRLYAEGSNGQVLFADSTTLSGGAKDIAGKTVTIADGKTVNVKGSAANVYTDNANYNKSNFGSFTGSGANTSGYSNRPKF